MTVEDVRKEMIGCNSRHGGEAVIRILKDVAKVDKISDADPSVYGVLIDALRK